MQLFAIALLLVSLLLPHAVYADSEQSYKDYVYQFDEYRRKYSEFVVAKNEYEKFKSLTSETAALDKTKAMMWQRSQLLRAYMLLLVEKTSERPGIGESDKTTYRNLMNNEAQFLDGHGALIQSIASLSDANRITGDLVARYQIMQTAFRQVNLGIILGSLQELAKEYDELFATAQALFQQQRMAYSLTKQQTIERWILQIQNKKNLYQQKYDLLVSGNNTLATGSQDELERTYTNLLKQALEAKQYLAEGSSYIKEFSDAIKFIN